MFAALQNFAVRQVDALQSVGFFGGGHPMSEHQATVVRLVIGPNASMSAAMAVAFFAGISTVSLSIALALTVMGYWPVLPFAGLELAALGAALWVSVRRNGYREVIRLEPERLRLEVGYVSRVRRRCEPAVFEIPRRYARVWLEQGPYRNSPTRLVLSGNGQCTELGRCLTDEERAALCRRLKNLLHPGTVPLSGFEIGAKPVPI